MGIIYQNDGFDTMRENFQDKIVHIYPGDTNGKNGKVIDITPAGITFLITASKCPSYEVGHLYFIAFSNRLTFEKVKSEDEK